MFISAKSLSVLLDIFLNSLQFISCLLLKQPLHNILQSLKTIFLSSQPSFPLVFRSYFILTWNNDNTSVLFQHFVTICNVWEIWKSTSLKLGTADHVEKCVKRYNMNRSTNLLFYTSVYGFGKKVTFIRSQAM